LFLLIVSFFITGCNSKKSVDIPEPAPQKQSEKKEIKWGDAPDFTVNTINNGTITLSQFKGKVIILNFWTTWRPPCRAEIPDFIALYNEYKDKGAIIIGLSVDKKEETVKKFIEENGINYPIGMGNEKIVHDYGGISGIPTSFIIDREGNIKEKFIGLRSKEVFENTVKKLF